MHELAITESVIDLIGREAKDKGFQKVLAISLRVGEYSGLIPACIQEFFPIAARGSIAEGAALDIQSIPAAFRCLDCSYEGPVERKAACCPDCGSTAIRMTAGREFFVDSLKVE